MAKSIDISRNASPGRSGRRRKLVLAALLGLMSAALVFLYLQGQVNNPASASSAPAPTVQVLTVVREIAANEPIQPDMVALKHIAPDAVVAGAFVSPEEVTGTIARFPMSVGEQITPVKVTRGGTDAGLAAVVPDGKRAMAITASAVVTAGGVLQPGDRVDVIAVVEQDPEEASRGKRVGTAVSSVVVEDAEVLAVAQRLVELVPPALSDDEAGAEERMTALSETGAAPDAAAATVTLALTLDEAQMVLLHEQQGLIRLLVRPSVTTAGAQ